MPRMRCQAAVKSPEGARVAGRASAAAATRRSGGGTVMTGTAAGSAARTETLTETGGTRSANPGAYRALCQYPNSAFLTIICARVHIQRPKPFCSQSNNSTHAECRSESQYTGPLSMFAETGCAPSLCRHCIVSLNCASVTDQVSTIALKAILPDSLCTRLDRDMLFVGRSGPGHAIMSQKGPSAAAMTDLTTPETEPPPLQTSSIQEKRSGRVEAQLPPPPQRLCPKPSPRGLWWSRPRSLMAAIHSLWMQCWTVSRTRLDTKAASLLNTLIASLECHISCI